MKKSYVKGILGALLGGLIASIPWIIVYVYMNMIYSFLAIIIAIGALKGYQLFKGKIDKKLPIIITVISLISVTVATLIIIPALMLMKESVPASIANMQYLYSNSEFISAIMGDYIISIIFTILGISGVVSSLKKQIKNDESLENVKIDLGNGNNKYEKEKVKNYFLTKNAISEDSAIEIDKNSDLNQNTIELLIVKRVIIQKDGKFYYCLENEEKENEKEKRTGIIIGVVVAIIVGIVVFIGITSASDSTDVIQDNFTGSNEVYFDKPLNYQEYQDEENSWIYVPKTDLNGYSGYIAVYCLEASDVYSEEWVEETLDIFEDDIYVEEIIFKNHFENYNGVEVAAFDVDFGEYDDTIYYLFGRNVIGVVEVIDYDKLGTLQQDGKDIVDSFKWSND